MLKSLAPNMVKKCAWYQFQATRGLFALNISKMVETFVHKQYPVTWWKSPVLSKACIGFEHATHMGITLGLTQTANVCERINH